jgi:hypothetical protein
MMQNIELLAQIQERIIECRRVAAEASAPGLALFLYRLADEVEAEAREADLIQDDPIGPPTSASAMTGPW